MTSNNPLAQAVEKYREVIKLWSESADPFKKALADTVLEAVEVKV